MNAIGLQQLVERLGWTILHSLWQACVIGVVAAVLLQVMRKQSAATRYAAALISLAAVPIWMIATFSYLSPDAASSWEGHESRHIAAGHRQLHVTGSEGQAEDPAGSEYASRPDAVSLASNLRDGAGTKTTSTRPPANWRNLFPLVRPALPVIVVGWAMGVVLLSLRLLWSFRSVNRLRRLPAAGASRDLAESVERLSRLLRIRQAVQLVISTAVEVPTLIGAWRPVILLPLAATTGLSPQQIDSVLAHELAHIRRHDYVINVLQRLIETLLFYHPVVWWLSGQVRGERENCCDDIASGVAGDRVAYVKALLELESLRSSAAPIALAASGGDLLQRARRLLEMRPTAGISSWWQANLLGLLVAGGVFSAIGGTWLMAAPLRDFQETAADGEATQEKRQDGAEGDFYVWHCTTKDKETGEPVSQVRVTWDFQRSDRRADEAAGPLSVWKQEFVSDENGRYEVQVPKSVMDESRRWLGIEYRHPRYLPSRNSFWPLKMPDDPRQGLDHRHILLEPGVKVTGRVILPGGAPAVDVPVMFARSREGFGDSNGGYYHGFWTRTDQQGRYEFYTRNTWPQRIHWFPDKYECNSRAMTREFGEQETIRLKEGLRLAGRVVDQQGEPLAQVVIRAATGTRVPYVFAASDDQGIFRFPPLPAGEYTLAPVRHYYDRQTGDSLTSELPTPIPAVRYVLDAATSSVDPKAVIQASPLVRIPVEVVDGTGKPLDGKMLSIGDLGDFENAVLGKPVEGEPGRYEFQYPRDQYVRDLRVRCSMGESAFYQLSDQFAPVAADAIVLGKATADFPIVRVVVRQAGTLKVTARTPDGKEPEGSSQIHVQYGSEQTARLEAANQANRDPRAIFMAPGLMISYPAGEPWNTTIQQIAPGVPVLVTLQSDKYVAEPQTVTLADGETKSIELVVKP